MSRRNTKVKRVITAIGCAAVLTATLTACGGGQGKTGAGSRTAAKKMSAGTLEKKAVADLRSAASVHVKGRFTDINEDDPTYGSGMGVDLTVVRGKGCEGSLAMGKNGSMKIEAIGAQLWVSPDAAFLRSQNFSATAAAAYQGKWLHTDVGDGRLKLFADLCTLRPVIDPALNDPSGVTESPATGASKARHTVMLIDSHEDATIDISTTPAPRLVDFTSNTDATNTHFAFDHFGAAVTLTPPTSGVISAGTVGI